MIPKEAHECAHTHTHMHACTHTHTHTHTHTQTRTIIIIVVHCEPTTSVAPPMWPQTKFWCADASMHQAGYGSSWVGLCLFPGLAFDPQSHTRTWASTHTHTPTKSCAHTWTQTCTFFLTLTHTHTCTHTHGRVHTHTHTQSHAHTHGHKHAHSFSLSHTHTHARTRACTNTHTQTHTHRDATDDSSLVNELSVVMGFLDVHHDVGGVPVRQTVVHGWNHHRNMSRKNKLTAKTDRQQKTMPKTDNLKSQTCSEDLFSTGFKTDGQQKTMPKTIWNLKPIPRNCLTLRNPVLGPHYLYTGTGESWSNFWKYHN